MDGRPSPPSRGGGDRTRLTGRLVPLRHRTCCSRRSDAVWLGRSRPPDTPHPARCHSVCDTGVMILFPGSTAPVEDGRGAPIRSPGRRAGSLTSSSPRAHDSLTAEPSGRRRGSHVARVGGAVSCAQCSERSPGRRRQEHMSRCPAGPGWALRARSPGVQIRSSCLQSRARVGSLRGGGPDEGPCAWGPPPLRPR